MAPALRVTGDDDADQLVSEDPLALLIGMLLDQQIPMEWAFMSPLRLQQRLGGELDAAQIAAMGEDDLRAVFAEKPALHRFHGSMAKRTHKLCQHLVDNYDGDAAAVWQTAEDPRELLARLEALPGYGEEKSKIFLAILGKRFGAAPDGWEEYAGPFGDDEPRSVADIGSPDALEEVREWKRQQKAKGKRKSD
ncbi:MAG: HhH-GPD-type base excision DNA repair protein [Nitriliruptorales bacterium]|nr:HhH-GPD-type base excision DNA repair protein [Nitriliruptorales bacterium]